MATVSGSRTISEESLSLPTWLTGVGEKLIYEGQLLLKLLYFKELKHASLADQVKEPRDLFELSRGTKTRSDDATLAVFIHRLSLLIPQPQPDADDPKEIMKIKDLGAQDCMDYLEKCRLSPPTVQVETSQESKLLECLVTLYVNLSQQRRRQLMQQVAKEVGVRRENFDTFELFCRLFTRASCKSQQIIDKFVSILNNAPVPLSVLENFIYQLESFQIPLHKQFSAGILYTIYNRARVSPIVSTIAFLNKE